jgi:hypothetical protein
MLSPTTTWSAPASSASGADRDCRTWPTTCAPARQAGRQAISPSPPVLDADLRLLAITERLRQHWSAHAAALGLTAAQVKVLLRLTSRRGDPDAQARPAA